MTLFASLIFLLLTPHTSQSVGQASDRAYTAGRTNLGFAVFVETVKIRENIRIGKINRELQKIDDAEFMRMYHESKWRATEAARKRERDRQADHVKQNPGG